MLKETEYEQFLSHFAIGELSSGGGEAPDPSCLRLCLAGCTLKKNLYPQKKIFTFSRV